MKQRCNNPNATSAPWYHDMGIKVCERWQHDFWAFVDDMGPKPHPSYTLDRINNEGDYEPANCRWATRSEQVRNARRGLGLKHNKPRGIRTLRKPLPFRGRQVAISDLARELGLDEAEIRSRVSIGWTLEEAVTIPKGMWRSAWYRENPRPNA
jgi:hypothetical protein